VLEAPLSSASDILPPRVAHVPLVRDLRVSRLCIMHNLYHQNLLILLEIRSASSICICKLGGRAQDWGHGHRDLPPDVGPCHCQHAGR
jgi:hypothetical protein